MQATTISERAREASECFETSTRPDGARFARIRDNSPEWVTELVHSAHGDMLPDDWRYSAIRSALEFIAESDNPEDGASEWADSEVDVYSGARLEWLGSHLSRPGYCDEGRDEFSSENLDIVEQIGLGQFMEASEVYGLVLQALEVAEVSS